jgi:arylsulfatase A-like enzyme
MLPLLQVVAAFAVLGMRSAQLQAVSDMPNIVFVMADDYGWGDVGYNNGTALTPNLDMMAAGQHSLRLQRYYSGGPVCSPTRGTVLTGRNHNRYCVWTANTGGNSPDFQIPETMPLPTSEFTVAEALKKKDYVTGLFGKWHLGDFIKLPGGNKKWPVSHPGMHGFDQWLATERSAPTATLNCGCFNQSSCVKGHYSQETFPCTNYWRAAKPHGITNETSLEDGDDSLYIMDHVEEFIRSAAANNTPFFVYIPLHAGQITHVPKKFRLGNYCMMSQFISSTLQWSPTKPCISRKDTI